MSTASWLGVAIATIICLLAVIYRLRFDQKNELQFISDWNIELRQRNAKLAQENTELRNQLYFNDDKDWWKGDDDGKGKT